MAAKKFSREFKDACIQEVIKNSEPVVKVARAGGVSEQTLRNWIADYRKKNQDAEPELAESDRAKLKRLEAENRELRMEVEFLGKATAYFAKKHQ